MADEVVKGINDFTMTGQEKVYRPESGWAVVKVYEGPRALEDAFSTTLINTGAIELRNSISKALCTITATFPLTPSGYNEDQKAQDEAVWELVPEILEKRLESHGKFNVSGSSQSVLEKIEKDLKAGIASDTDWDSIYAGLGAFNAYRDLRIMGTDSYQSYTWRVRCTKTVSRVSLLKAVYTNVGKVIAWSSIGVPASSKFTQPTIHMVKPLTGGGFTDESVNEWLVQPPTVRWKKGIRKWEIVQEWLGAVSISSTLYDGGGQTP